MTQLYAVEVCVECESFENKALSTKRFGNVLAAELAFTFLEGAAVFGVGASLVIRAGSRRGELLPSMLTIETLSFGSKSIDLRVFVNM